jgi:transposase
MDIIKLDARKLKPQEQYILRVRFITAWINNGKKDITKLVKIFGMSYRTALRWIDLYIENGWEGLKHKKKGKEKDKFRRVKSDTMDKVVKIIETKLPEDYNLPGIHWTSKIIVQLIKDKFNISIGQRTILYYLKEKRLSFLKGELKE